LSAYRAVAGDLRLSYSQFEELEAFSRFGTRLDEDTRRTLERGRRVREVLKQPQYKPLPVSEQIAVLVAVNKGAFDGLSLERIHDAEKTISSAVTAQAPELCERIERGEDLRDTDLEDLLKTAKGALEIKNTGINNNAHDRRPEEKDSEH